MIDPVMGGNATPVSWRGTMIIQVLHCPNCQGTDIVRHGKTRQGKQRYRCREKGCAGRTFLLEYAYVGRSPDTGGGYPCFFCAAMDSEAARMVYRRESSAIQKGCKITHCVYEVKQQIVEMAMNA